MYNDFQSPIKKKEDPWGIYISPNRLSIILVVVILLLVASFIFGVFMGKREFAIQLEQQSKQTEATAENKPSVKTDTREKTEPPKSETPTTANTNSTKGAFEKLENTSPVDKPTTEQTVTTVAPTSTTGSSAEPAKATETPTTAISDTSTISPPTDNPQPPKQVELTPITPPIDQDITTPPVEKQSVSQNSVTPDVNVKQKPKTYSIQLSALTGDDAEKRARSIVEKFQKKYKNQFVFKIQPAGKFYKIAVINIPDEKTARESLKILSQEPDFKKAFIVKPQK